MPHPRLNRFSVKLRPLAERQNKKRAENDFVPPDRPPSALSPAAAAVVAEAVERIRAARAAGKPVMLAFGAHAIKNGLAPVLIRLIENGWVTLLATNGAGVIHDWEFAFQGSSSEDVKAGVERGEFGNWQETGFCINLAINVGAYEGKGYGEAVGAFIENDGVSIPEPARLEAEVKAGAGTDPEQAAAAADLLAIIRAHGLRPGALKVAHPFKRFSAQAAAYRLGVPFTAHPMIGHDIIYNHPMNHGASLGRAAVRDFLVFAEQVSRIGGGVYLSVGSAVMSPMVFEKSMSMGQNLARQQSRRIEGHFICVVDLAESRWDWTRGDPPESSPDYYLRYNKSFSRMGGTMRYATADNRDFLLALWQGLGPAGNRANPLATVAT